MAILIQQGIRVKDALSPITRDYVVTTENIYQFHITIQDKHFGEGVQYIFEKDMFEKIMDSYDVTDPYGKSLWWGAGGEEVIIQLVSSIARPLSEIWNHLRNVFTHFFPDNIIVWGKSFEGPRISSQRVEEGRGMHWWEKIADWFKTVGGGAAEYIVENPTFIKTVIILGGITISLYALSTIAKKLPKRK